MYPKMRLKISWQGRKNGQFLGFQGILTPITANLYTGLALILEIKLTYEGLFLRRKESKSRGHQRVQNFFEKLYDPFPCIGQIHCEERVYF